MIGGLILQLILALPGTPDTTCAPWADALRQALAGESDIDLADWNHAVCARSVDEPGDVIAAVPVVISGDDTLRIADVILAVVRENGERIASLRIDEAIVSDTTATQFAGMTIDATGYRLDAQRRAFGLHTRYSGGSPGNPDEDEVLDLFVLRDGHLVEVLRGLVIHTKTGTWDGQCAGEFHRERRELSMRAGEPMATLVVQGTVFDEATRKVGDECVHDLRQRKAPQRVLVPGGGRYVVPYDIVWEGLSAD